MGTHGHACTAPRRGTPLIPCTALACSPGVLSYPPAACCLEERQLRLPASTLLIHTRYMCCAFLLRVHACEFSSRLATTQLPSTTAACDTLLHGMMLWPAQCAGAHHRPPQLMPAVLRLWEQHRPLAGVHQSNMLLPGSISPTQASQVIRRDQTSVCSPPRAGEAASQHRPTQHHGIWQRWQTRDMHPRLRHTAHNRIRPHYGILLQLSSCMPPPALLPLAALLPPSASTPGHRSMAAQLLWTAAGPPLDGGAWC